MAQVRGYNRRCLSTSPINAVINAPIKRAESPESNVRQYLGASSVGSKYLRRIQFDWFVDPVHPTRTRDIFAREYLFEELSRWHLVAAWFCFAPPERLDFQVVGGLFRGHADGIITDGLELPSLSFPRLWEYKALAAKGWRAIKHVGLKGAYPQYAAQVSLYQAYLDVAEHQALFTVVNCDTRERLHLLVPFNAERAQEWSDRAVAVIRATRTGELLPRFTDDPRDWRRKICGHLERCWR